MKNTYHQSTHDFFRLKKNINIIYILKIQRTSAFTESLKFLNSTIRTKVMKKGNFMQFDIIFS